MPAQPQYGQYNPLIPYQQRLDQMQQQYAPMQSQPPAQPQAAPMMGQVKGWPVSGEDEARRAMVDLDGSVFWFPDVNGGKVYSKQISTTDFSPIFRTYQYVEAPAAPAQPAQFDTSMFAQRDEVEQLRATIATMQETIDHLTAPQPVVTQATTSKEGKTK